MTLRCVGSGSSGNSYALIDKDGKILILDLGLQKRRIVKGIDYRVSDIVAAVVTHGHHDHDLSVKDFKNMGIPVWQPYLDGIKSQHHKFGSFSVQSFEVPHDGCDCVGYYIAVDGHRILYATDFEYLPCSFKNVRLTDMLVECNHQKSLVDRNEAKYSHQIRGHCSLETLIDKVVKENMTGDLRNVILCHLSEDSSDPQECLEEVQKVAGNGVMVDVAMAGKSWELSLYPF